MSVELERTRSASRGVRIDRQPDRIGRAWGRWIWVLLYLATAGVFVWGSLGRELGENEARLAIAAHEGAGPLGKVFGGWSPDLSPGSVAVSSIVARVMGDDAAGWPGVVHLPRIIGLFAMGGIAALGTARVFSAGLGFGAWFAVLGCLGWIDRSSAFGLDIWSALSGVVFLDQILRRGSTWIAGHALAFGFLMSGLPTVILGWLVVLVLGRRGGYFNHRLLLPPMVAMAAWSGWALRIVPAEAWAFAFLGPLKWPIAWATVPTALVLALPWTPHLGLLVLPGLWRCWGEERRAWVEGLGRAALVAAGAGSVVPGLGRAGLSWLVTVVVVMSAVSLVTALKLGGESRIARLARWLGALVCVAWATLAIPPLTALAVLAAYYRELAIALGLAAAFGMAYSAIGAWTGRGSWVMGGLAAVSLGLGLTYSSVYGVERDYRVGVGPWGRAIGQWVPPQSVIHVFHAERADLMYATGRTVRQLVAPAWLEFVDVAEPRYVLLLASEHEHWPAQAPRIEAIRTFRDASGAERVLARTLTSLR